MNLTPARGSTVATIAAMKSGLKASSRISEQFASNHCRDEKRTESINVATIAAMKSGLKAMYKTSVATIAAMKSESLHG